MIDVANTPVLILAGGKATRLGDIARSVPKALVPVAGKPFLDHQLEDLARQGVREVVMCIGHLADQIRAHAGNGSRYGLRVSYSEDGPLPLGTGGAVRQALPLFGEACFVLYGDSLLDVSYTEALAALGSALGVMTVFANANSFDTSNVLWRNGRLVRYSKTARTPDMAHIDYGLSVLRREAVERIPTDRATDLAELYTVLVERGEMVGHEVFNRFYEIGSPAGLKETEAFVSRRVA